MENSGNIFFRTLACAVCTFTETLCTPATFCAASVTLRAQLLQVIPSTCSSVVAGDGIVQTTNMPPTGPSVELQFELGEITSAVFPYTAALLRVKADSFHPPVPFAQVRVRFGQ